MRESVEIVKKAVYNGKRDPETRAYEQAVCRLLTCFLFAGTVFRKNV